MRTASPLWQRITDWQVQALAVVGMTKNTGKTVCLNHLIEEAGRAGRAAGLTSIGRDGEERDQVYAFPKPPVRVGPGCLVATAQDTLVRAKVRVRRIGGTGVESPMGEIVIVKAMEAGDMEVAGASRGHDQQTVMARLRQCGAQLILLDGALGRSHHASPAIADAVVLATGAAIGGGIDDVLRKTRDRLAILGVQPADEALMRQLRATCGQGGVCVWDTEGHCLFNEPIASINAASALMALPPRRIATVAVSGAVGKLLWQALCRILDEQGQARRLTVVVADGTRLFVDAGDVAAFEAQGGHLRAMRGIRLLGVTLNPFSPFGGSFEAGAFLDRARQVLAPQLVTDVVHKETHS